MLDRQPAFLLVSKTAGWPFDFGIWFEFQALSFDAINPLTVLHCIHEDGLWMHGFRFNRNSLFLDSVLRLNLISCSCGQMLKAPHLLVVWWFSLLFLVARLCSMYHAHVCIHVRMCAWTMGLKMHFHAFICICMWRLSEDFAQFHRVPGLKATKCALK